MTLQSYRRALARSARHGGLANALNGSLRVRVSKELRISGVVGHVASLGESEPNVAEIEVRKKTRRGLILLLFLKKEV